MDLKGLMAEFKHPIPRSPISNKKQSPMVGMGSICSTPRGIPNETIELQEVQLRVINSSTKKLLIPDELMKIKDKPSPVSTTNNSYSSKDLELFRQRLADCYIPDQAVGDSLETMQ